MRLWYNSYKSYVHEYMNVKCAPHLQRLHLGFLLAHFRPAFWEFSSDIDFQSPSTTSRSPWWWSFSAIKVRIFVFDDYFCHRPSRFNRHKISRERNLCNKFNPPILKLSYSAAGRMARGIILHEPQTTFCNLAIDQGNYSFTISFWSHSSCLFLLE